MTTGRMNTPRVGVTEEGPPPYRYRQLQLKRYVTVSDRAAGTLKTGTAVPYLVMARCPRGQGGR